MGITGALVGAGCGTPTGCVCVLRRWYLWFGNLSLAAVG